EAPPVVFAQDAGEIALDQVVGGRDELLVELGVREKAAFELHTLRFGQAAEQIVDQPRVDLLNRTHGTLTGGWSESLIGRAPPLPSGTAGCRCRGVRGCGAPGS